MRPLHELIDQSDPAFPLIREWVREAIRPVELLPASAVRDQVLYTLQVTTHSTLGAVVYETGGILIDHGWLRILGSGNGRLTRTVPGWNQGRAEGFLLVADDVVGGFFAVNGGALGPDLKNVYYFAPDALRWEALNVGYSDFVHWACVGKLDVFYDSIRWPGWEKDVAQLRSDRCFFFAPPLFSKEGKGGTGRRGDVPVEESWGFQMDFRRQLDE